MFISKIRVIFYSSNLLKKVHEVNSSLGTSYNYCGYKICDEGSGNGC